MSAPAILAPLILASSSPRRVELLQEAGYHFAIVKPEVEELDDPTLSCEALTQANAELKAVAVAQVHPHSWIIAADTMVYLGDKPYGKPATLEQAHQMLRELSNRSHTVCTGVTVIHHHKQQQVNFTVRSEVIFRELDDNCIRQYHSLINPMDKAGAYAIQQESDMIIAAMHGSWSNVKGLPMERLTEVLEDLQIPKG